MLEFIALALVVLVALPVHEMAHGFAAYRLGDMTAKNMGRLTMNPLPIWTLRYADDFSFRVWLCEACPGKSQSIPQSQSGMALTALAGPVSNLLMAVVSVGLYRIFALLSRRYWWITFSGWCLSKYLLKINVGLAIFNLLPVPPLDGFRILSLVLPNRWIYLVDRYENYIIILVMFLIFTGVLPVLPFFLTNVIFRGILMLFGLI